MFDTIEDISPKSALSYRLLKSDYRTNDVDYIEEQRLRNLVVDGKLNFSAIRKMFFKAFIKKFGKLKCQICNNDDLIIKPLDNKYIENLATIEHIRPKSLGGFKYNPINFLCTCAKCNNDRGLKPLFHIGNDMWAY